MTNEPDWNRRRVAVYWDLENIVAGYFETVHGKGSWREATKRQDCTEERQSRLREARLDLDAVMAALAPATVMINRAYGNWTSPWLRGYASDVQRHAIDAIQMFPTCGAKNGADIRLALDVANDLLNYPPITDVVVVGGDSDYIALAQHCHRHNRRFTVVTVKGAASRHLVSAADHTYWYEDLVPETVPEDVPEPAPAARPASDPQVTALLETAVAQLSTTSETGWINSSGLHSKMTRLDPTFALAEGERMRELLDRHVGSLLEERRNGPAREVRLLRHAQTGLPVPVCETPDVLVLPPAMPQTLIAQTKE